MSTGSGSTLRDLISQLSHLIKKRPISPLQTKQKPINSSGQSSSLSSDRNTTLSKRQLDYIVQQTTKRILDSLLHNNEVRQQFSEILCNRCSNQPSNLDISFCSPPKNQIKPVLKQIGNNKVEWIMNMHHIRNKTDQLVSKIKEIN